MINWAGQIRKYSIEIDITWRCNLRCLNCDRALRHAPSNEDMSLGQINKFVRETRETGWSWKLLKLIGGEPTLHPQLNGVIMLMERFHKWNPQCEIQLWTNGYDKNALRKLEWLPSWIRLVNSDKEGIRNAFVSFNLAPVDDKHYKQLDFGKGCLLLKHCGLGLNRYGYYPCPAGATVDRVFGFDIGGKNLKEYLEKEQWHEQLSQLCQYCGHFKHQFRREWTRKEKISRSWAAAFENYNQQKPKLSLY